ncbi:MAG TPA: hypothetical protein VFH78_09905 [Candidatus Thermoplasmatota archaeon]|nr:hypothetical protein [Candidatus Thermoplasmatota archaeon]
MQGNAVLMAILLAAPLLTGCAALDRPDRWDLEVSLGVIVSSKLGATLDDVSSAVDLGARQWNEMGAGIRYILVTDAASDNAAAAYERLAQRRVAAVIAAVPPDEAGALAQRADQRRIPLLLVTPPSSPLSVSDMDAALQLAPPVQAEADALASLAQARNASRAFVLHTNDPYARAAAAAFDAAYGGAILQTRAFERDAPAFLQSAARDVCASDADSVVLFAPGREAGRVVRGLVEGECRGRITVFASSAARQLELAEEAGEDASRRSHAAGVIGVEPAASRLGEFRALFVSETGRTPSPYAAEAYDAVSIVSLAAFRSKGSADAEPVRATIAGGDLLPHLRDVYTSPGVKLRERAAAAEAAKRGDQLDWVGYAHDFDLTNAGAPNAAAYDQWTVTNAGTIERVGRV